MENTFNWAKLPDVYEKEDVEKEIERLTNLRDLYYNEEQGIKLFINSVYGATGSPYFVGYNTSIAESITLQGQSLIKFVNRLMEKYCKDLWQKDVQLHSILGIDTPSHVFKDVVIYNDTDSVYMSMEPLFLSCNYKGTIQEFSIALYKNRLKSYLDESFAVYAKKVGTSNLQNLEMEKFADSIILLAKKKYIMDITWKDSGKDAITYPSGTKLTIKGIEIIQSSTPPFVRQVLTQFVKYLIVSKGDLKLNEVVAKLKEIKKNFKISNIEEICKSSKISDYNKFILKDKQELLIGDKCPIHVKGAGIYNFTLSDSKHRKKYQVINSGDKVKYYYTTSKSAEHNVFAFLPNAFPYEFAPPIDFEMQFEKLIMDPVNRLITALGLNAIPPTLVVAKSLF